MSQLATNLAADLPGLMDVAGEPLTYTPLGGGAAVSLTGILSPTPPQRHENKDGQTIGSTAEAFVAAAALAAPAAGGTLATASESWTVKTMQRIAGGAFWRLALVRSQQGEKSRQDFRLTR
jgi:hypothetical protein